MGVLMAIAYLCGRYSSPEKVTVDKTKDLMISELQRQIAFKSSDKIQSTTTVKKPDGTYITRTKIEYRNVSVTAHDESKQSHDIETSHTVTENRRGVVVQGLIGFDGKPIYGAAFNKQVLGPINIGAFMFTDLRVGVSLGLEF